MISQGVKYIKIARYDANGNDNQESLRELTSIKISTVDRGVVTYPVATVREYPSSSLSAPYYLYQILATNITSSTNNQILNYRLEVTQSSPSTYSTNADSGLLKLGSISNPYDAPVTDVQNYFSTASGLYVLGNTPNIALHFTASYRISTTTGTVRPVLAAIVNGGASSYTTSSAISSLTLPSGTYTGQTMTISGSFTPVEGQTFGIYFGDLTTTTNQVITPEGNGVRLLITQSTSPNPGIGAQVYLTPDIVTAYATSPYNAVGGVIQENRTSRTFYDVDYSNSQNKPVNLFTILSGSATPAQVQDSNYTTRRVISSRYEGRQLNSPAINRFGETVIDVKLGKTYTNTADQIAYGKLPNVESRNTHFIRFNWLGGTSPEWGNNLESKTNVSIKDIIDETGQTTLPIEDNNQINLDIIQQTFENSNVILMLSNPEAFGVNFNSLNTKTPVFKAGKKIKPILYTQTASYDGSGNVIGFGYTGSISFREGGQGLAPVFNYNLYAEGANPLLIGSADSLGNVTLAINQTPLFEGIVPFSAINSGSHTVFKNNTSEYIPTGSLGDLASAGYILYFDATLKSTQPSNGSVINYFLQKSINNGATWTDAAYKQITYNGSTNPDDYKISFTEFNAISGSLYRITVGSQRGPQSVPPGSIPPNSQLLLDKPSYRVLQFPAFGGSCTSFWSGSTSDKTAGVIYAASNGLNNFIGYKQIDILGSGFDPVTLDFLIQPYDEIRFEGLENLSYTITQVTQSATTGQLQLVLNRGISATTNLDYFLIRRYVDDPGNLILDISKAAGQTSDGILFSEFLGEQAEKVRVDLVNKLTQGS